MVRWLAGASCVALALAASPAAGSSAQWQSSYTSPYPLASGDYGAFTSVAAISKSSALAAGFSEKYLDSKTTPIIDLWNGTKWSPWAHQPAVAKQGFRITSLVASSLSNVWLTDTPDRVNPVNQIRHWNGSTWQVVTSGGLPQNWSGSLILIHGRPWLVGAGVTYPLDPTAAFIASYGKVGGKPHWTERTISRFGLLSAGSDVNAHNAWAVGGTHDGTYDPPDGTPIAMHWNGKQWARTTLPHGPATLTAVAASRHAALAVGVTSHGACCRADSGYTRTPVAYLWQHGRWHALKAPPDATELDAVAADDAGGFWAAGSATGDPTHTVYFRYRNGSWTTVQGPSRTLPATSPDAFPQVTAMAGAAGPIWAVGYIAAHDCDDTDGCARDEVGRLFVDRS